MTAGKDILGFQIAFALLLFVSFCGYLQFVNYFNESGNLKCESSFLINNIAPARDSGLFLLVILISFIGTAFAVRKITTQDLIYGFGSSLLPAFLRIAEIILKLSNPILQALRRGILNPQIYDSVFATN